MKTSFYFVLWIGIYLLIDLFGGAGIQEYSFIIALVAVYALSGMLNNALRTEIGKQLATANVQFFEMLYTNDYRQQRRMVRKRLLFDAGTFAYMAITTVVLLSVVFSGGGTAVVALVIFALFTYWFGKRALADYGLYRVLMRAPGVVIPTDQAFEQLYQQYCNERATKSYRELLPARTTRDKVLAGFNVGFSVVCVVIGLAFIGFSVVNMLLYGYDLVHVMNIAYGGLALAFGLNDFVTSV